MEFAVDRYGSSIFEKELLGHAKRARRRDSTALLHDGMPAGRPSRELQRIQPLPTVSQVKSDLDTEDGMRVIESTT
jgi:hypothetical protein